MKEPEDVTKEQLIKDLAELRSRITELERSEQDKTRSQEDLARAKAMFEGLFQFAPDAIIVAGQGGEIVQANNQAERLFGYSRDEFADLRLEDLVPERFREIHREHRRMFMLNPRVRPMGTHLELYGRKKEGSEFFADIALGPLKAGDGIVVMAVIRDVSAQKMAEAGLRRTQALLSEAEKLSHSGAWEWDIAADEWTVSEGWLRIHGSGKRTLSRDELFPIAHPDDRAAIEQAFDAVRKGIKPFDMEHRIIRQDTGEVRTIRSHGQYKRDAAGAVVTVCGFAQDVTERRRAEEALAASENRYRTLFNAIDEGFCIVKVIFDQNEKPIDYRFLEINPSFEKQTGLIAAKGKRMRELAPKHEEHWFQIYGNVALTGQSVRFQNRAEQLHRWYDVYAFRFGKPEDRQVAILFNDITKRKEAEETLELTKFSVDHASVSAFLIGKDARILYVNEQACSSLGYSREALLHMTIPDLDPNVPMSVWKDIWEKLKKEGSWRSESLHRRNDGTLIPVEISANYISFGGKEYDWAYSVNISERKQSEEALRRAARTGSRLQEVMVAMSSSRTFEEAMKLLLDAAAELTGMEGGGIYLIEKDTAVLRYHSGTPDSFVREVQQVPMDSPIVEATLKQKALLDLAEEIDDSRVPFKKHGLRHAFSIPLRIHGEPFGFLNIGSTRAERPRETDIQTLTILATETESLMHRLFIEQALRESEERFRSAFAHAAFGMALTSPEGRILQVNRSLCQMSGYSEQELLGRKSDDLTHPDDREATLALRDDLVKGRRDYGWLEKRYIHRDGHLLWAVLSVAVIRDSRGTPLYFVSQIQDVTDRKRAEEELTRSYEVIKTNVDSMVKTEEALRKSEESLKRAQEIAHLGSWELDLRNDRLTWSDEVYRIFGLEPQAFKATYEAFLEAVHPDDRTAVDDAYSGSLLEGRDSYEIEHRVIRRSDNQVRIVHEKCHHHRDESGKVIRSVGMVHDITERKQMEEQIRHLAHHDSLTGLPNRRLFRDILHVEVAQSRRNRKKLAILFLDLDRFKDINDTLGHEVGDELLKQAARLFRETIRASDTVARIGGDEFNIILADISRPEDVSDIAQKITRRFRFPFSISGNELHVTTSIGVSVYPDDSTEIDTLLRYADIAMYHAKEGGRDTFRFYNPAINVSSIERMRMENMLRRSIAMKELVVYYQPQIDIQNKRMTCAEALVRWQHPEKGFLTPDSFLAQAEKTGFITEIDEWTLQTVCAQVRSWIDSDLPPVCVTVNVSARQFEKPDLVHKIAAILKETGLEPGYLELEVTESTAMRDVERTASQLRELREMGVHVSIDDFGTGYSSLSYLKKLPIERLKIDKSFIRDIATDSDDRAIISAVTSMARKMGIRTVAEGVETEEQLSFLRDADCDEAQGFLFNRPVPAEEFRELVLEGR